MNYPTALPLKWCSAETKGHVTWPAWHVDDPPPLLNGLFWPDWDVLIPVSHRGSTPRLEGPVTSCSRFHQLIDGSIKELRGTYDMLFLAPIEALRDSYRESNCCADGCRVRRHWGPIKIHVSHMEQRENVLPALRLKHMWCLIAVKCSPLKVISFFGHKYTVDCISTEFVRSGLPAYYIHTFPTLGSVLSASPNTWTVSKQSLRDSVSASTVKISAKRFCVSAQLKFSCSSPYQSFLSIPRSLKRTSPQVRTAEIQTYCVHKYSFLLFWVFFNSGWKGKMFDYRQRMYFLLQC